MNGCGRRLWRRRRAGSATGRKKGERVEVRVAVAYPNTEMEVRHIVLRLACRARVGQDVAFDDPRATADPQRSKMRERDPVLTRRDRHRETVRRHAPGERDLSGHGRANHAGTTERDVHSAVLSGRVRVTADEEPPQDVTVGRPGPRPRRRPSRERPGQRESETRDPSRCP
jgi:hypothetical protein